jgi:type II secretory pathway component PulF
MLFVYTALNARGERISETLEAPDLSHAQQELLRRGLCVLECEPRRRRTFGGGARSAAPVDRSAFQNGPQGGLRARGGELTSFVRQLSMMLRAGASVVPALRAIEEQAGRAAWRAVLADLGDRVEGGATLHDALAAYPRIFPSALRSIVAAGESTGALADSFLRLTLLLEARQRLRRRVGGALVYPAMLMLMAAGVLATMMFFVLPRFRQLFEMLHTPLPALTQLLLDASNWLRIWWAPAVGIPLAAFVAGVLWLRTPLGRAVFGTLLLRVPLIGRAVAGVALAQLLQTWAALLRSRVSLLEAVQQTRDATSNPVFRDLVHRIEESIVQGRSMSGVLRASGLVPPTIVSTIATGEESGKLGEALEFVGGWIEEENDALMRAITRLLEPAILVVMGVVIGGVAISLFLPLFDIATAAG